MTPWTIALEQKTLRLDETTLVHRSAFDGTWPSAWRVECGAWEPTPAGLVGSIAGDQPAVVWCDVRFPFDHALCVRATAVAPHTSDANGFFRGAGRIAGPDEHRCWIAGNAGWWQHDDGLEKHPAGPTWRRPGRPLSATLAVTFAAGVSDDTVFLCKDGALVVADRDPDPLPAAEFCHVGLGTWDSKICFHACEVHRI